MKRRLVVGISGATGVIYGVRLLAELRQLGVETHLVISRPGVRTLRDELALTKREVEALADVAYPIEDIGAAIASGSFATMGMVVAPCSMRTLAAVATGLGDNLLTRAADVTLKERRPLVLLVRETPLGIVHLRNMLAAAEAGAIIMPPLPAFYLHPRSIEELVDHTVGRVLALFGLESRLLREWQGAPSAKAGESTTDR
ncbi:putative UbiX-like flavin prenyltransferase [bacterium HR40]|nr:putative UbiX-like flavin prenyltransferase [bacterium HR40]